MGKKTERGDDWHFDIQHIRAQTEFIRNKAPDENYVVIYLENKYKSWPAWKTKNPGYSLIIPRIIDSLTDLIKGKRKQVFLNGHSGGGSFIFGYLAGVTRIPGIIKRISFLDSDYGYDSSYYPKIKEWLLKNKKATLTVFAYNDSIALLNGKSFVSPTGGTWYRSHLLLKHLQQDFTFTKLRDDSLVVYKNDSDKAWFFFRKNPDRLIYHTVQVELNGFIHSVFCGTDNDSKGYTYFGERAYSDLIK